MARVCDAYHARGIKVLFHSDGNLNLILDGLVEAGIDGRKVVLLCPHTYMNRSGVSVLEARDFFQVELPDLLVVCDDFNLPLARLRFRAKGSSGGQKGLQDVIRCLGTDQFSRLRIGIGSPPEHWDVADFVLSKFSREDGEIMNEAVRRAAAAAADWTREGVEVCMNRYNGE
jgi:PTH1 family peptidyl-tRNA hydrolase